MCLWLKKINVQLMVMKILKWLIGSEDMTEKKCAEGSLNIWLSDRNDNYLNCDLPSVVWSEQEMQH